MIVKLTIKLINNYFNIFSLFTALRIKFDRCHNKPACPTLHFDKNMNSTIYVNLDAVNTKIKFSKRVFKLFLRIENKQSNFNPE